MSSHVISLTIVTSWPRYRASKVRSASGSKENCAIPPAIGSKCRTGSTVGDVDCCDCCCGTKNVRKDRQMPQELLVRHCRHCFQVDLWAPELHVEEQEPVDMGVLMEPLRTMIAAVVPVAVTSTIMDYRGRGDGGDCCGCGRQVLIATLAFGSRGGWTVDSLYSLGFREHCHPADGTMAKGKWCDDQD
ncbi:unnamed protein product [Heligmosomoides polygyrus]|uniref:Uncharacterized protein n=1 Tax=Heligmosomoides polygyrus TaxID=6339 RepID=A0A183GP17_HELPZ|nr:unnamed protein product [Heligmosomoides polygyrus]